MPELLTAVYDLRAGPVSYDFLTWLVRAKLEQQRVGARRLHVVILPNVGGLGGFARHWGPHDEHATYWRLWHIVMAACPLADATVTLSPTRSYMNQGVVWEPQGKAHMMAPLVDAARAGETIPLLRPSIAAERWAREWAAGGRTVTLTLRRNANDGRDSSPDWEPFAGWLRSERWRPLVIGDTADALKQSSGAFAALSLDLRAALYVNAAMNCFGNAGPQVLGIHTRAPYLSFNAALPDTMKAHWEKHLSLKTGDQVPWAGPDQRLVYRPDSLDVMIEEFQCAMAGSSSMGSRLEIAH